MHHDRDWHPPALTPGYKTSITRSPNWSLIALQYVERDHRDLFGQGMLGPLDNDLTVNFTQPDETAMGPCRRMSAVERR